ncbi:MAG: choice-of-anchor L domain-containing protein [Bacteroidales bacterium]|jgi:PKD repeat protein|nr:choice-of-anchor L domain-containing protein [Bacteroidales bacterium]
MKKIIALVVFLINFSLVYCQPYITVSNLPLQALLNDTLIASCDPSSVTNITTPTCNNIGYFNRNGSAFPFQSGIVLVTGPITEAPGPDNSGSTGQTACSSSDPDLVQISGSTIQDVSKVEFDFTPALSTITFRYIFASEEFPEFVNSINDAFGFFLSGPGISGPFTNGAINIAILPNGQPATINNIYNSGLYTLGGYYTGATTGSGGNNNPAVSPYGNSIQFDGASIILTAVANVQIGQLYHIKIVVGDAQDGVWDSGVFLEAGSFIMQEEGGLESITDGNGSQVGQTAITTLTCNNSSIQIQAFGGDTYLWTEEYGNIPPTSGQILTVTQPGLYHVTVQRELCNVVEEHEIQIFSDFTVPTINVTSPNTIISCLNPEVSATASGNGISYQWSGGISPNTVQNYFTSPGTYTVTATGENGCTAAASITFTYQEGISLVAHISQDVSCNGENDGVMGIVFTGGYGPFTYIWNDGVTTQNRQNVAAGSYSITISDAYNCTLTENYTITQPPLFVYSSSSTNVLCYNTPTGTINTSLAGGTTPYTYHWADNATTQNRNELPTGMYYLTITDAHNCKITDNFIITQPEEFITTVSNDQIICEGLQAILQTQSFGGTYPYEFHWAETPTPNNFEILEDTRTLIPNTTTTFFVYATDANGCISDTASTQIIVSPYLVIDEMQIKNNTCFQSCDGEARVIYHGGTFPYNLSWASNNEILSDLCKGTYTLKITDKYGCNTTTSFTISEPREFSSVTYSDSTKCYGSSDGVAAITPDGGTKPYTYIWYDGTSDSSINLPAGNYIVTVYDANHCRLTANFTIGQPMPLYSTPIENATICRGQNVFLITETTGGTPPYDYHWADSYGEEHENHTWAQNPIQTTTYSLTVTDHNGCTYAINPATITINSPIGVVSIVSDKDLICPGEDTQIRVDVNGGNGGPYMMRLQDGRIVGSPFIVNPMETTWYYITVEDMCGSPSATDSVLIKVSSNPNIEFTASVLNGCPPLTVEFTDHSESAFVNYFWTFGDNNFSTDRNTIFTYNESGTYSVVFEVTDSEGCVHKRTFNDLITVYPKPQAIFSYSPELITTYQPEIIFNNLSLGATSYMWSFGDNDSTELVNPTHHYMPSIDSYDVCLFAENNFHCRDTSCRPIEVEGIMKIYFPTAFSPDGDGLNECFRPCGNFIDPRSYNLTIYDRYGILVFETNTYVPTTTANDCSSCSDNDWNGKRNNRGNIMQNGIYTWHCTFEDMNGTFYEYNGTVTLLR